MIRLHSCGREEVVVHVPQNLFKSEVTGKRVNREGAYCLEILARFRYYGPEKATQCLETGLIKMKEQLKESVNYY